MGYAKINAGITEDRGYGGQYLANNGKLHRMSSDQCLAALEKQLKKDRLLFVEDVDGTTTVIRWGSDLTTEERAEMEAVCE